MSCTDCDERPIRGSYVRVGDGNVEIVACAKHWRIARAYIVTEDAARQDIAWCRQLEADLPFTWWWRPDEVPPPYEPLVVMLCWRHGAAALEHGWRPGAANLYGQLSRDPLRHEVCAACERGFDLEEGR